MKDLRSYLTNYMAADTDHPYGKFKDNPGDGSGSGIAAQTENNIYYAIVAVIEALLTGGLSDLDENVNDSDLLDAILEQDAKNMKLAGTETVTGDKNFTGSLKKSGNDVVTTSSGTQTIAGTKTFSGDVDFSGQVRPRTGPTLGTYSVGYNSRYTPPRGWYNASTGAVGVGDNRGGHITNDTFGSFYSGSMGGPYSGTTATRVFNDHDSSNFIWYYARF